MKTSTWQIIAAIFIITTAYAVANPAAGQPSFFQTKWVLKKIIRGDSVTTVNTKAFIRFDNKKNSAGGNGSCNSFGGTLLVKNDSISITHIFSTQMYCEAVQTVENAFFHQLKNVNRYVVKGKKLCLYNYSALLLEFRAE